MLGRAEPPAPSGRPAAAWRSLSRWTRPVGRPPRRSTEGRVVYAVGDVHGCADLLDELLALIAEDAATLGRALQLVLLGDYVDRGPDSARALERLVALRSEQPDLVHLLGNHDDMLLRFLQKPALGAAWCARGGAQTLASYGVRVPPVNAPEEAWSLASAALLAVMPPQHLKFLGEARLSWSVGDYFFSHAGARPGTPLHLQERDDLLGIRDVFLRNSQPFEKVVVHGHTPSAGVHVDQRRIGVDTGAYATNILAAIRLSNGENRIIQVDHRPPPSGPRSA